MSNQQTLTRRFGAAELTVPSDELFSAWLKHQLGMSIKVGRDVPSIGAQWEGEGGINGGLARDADGKPYWLILPPAEVSSFTGQWGGYEIDEPGAKSDFDGLANTIALCESSVDHPAAQMCRQLVYEGHSDFYLPAKREGAVLYANVPEQFEKVWHLLSTQYSANDAWLQYFGAGGQYHAYKGIKGRFRAVRRLDF
ncbi:hypothetical protein [Paraburkholderia sp.]|uniref:hypothetical protein n=1 Tax=Paraburkholderia sp. TaxID=1926495 RepID=UPI003C7B34E8